MTIIGEKGVCINFSQPRDFAYDLGLIAQLNDRKKYGATDVTL